MSECACVYDGNTLKQACVLHVAWLRDELLRRSSTARVKGYYRSSKKGTTQLDFLDNSLPLGIRLAADGTVSRLEALTVVNAWNMGADATERASAVSYRYWI